MKHIVDHQYSMRIRFIELLNKIGLNIIHIDNTYYYFQTFTCADEVTPDHTLVGCNITDLVESRTQTVGASLSEQETLNQEIRIRTQRMRKFHKDTPYVQYINTL